MSPGGTLSETPKNCSVCGTAVAPGAVRCVACGAVFGEDNRCPHCHALAAVQAMSDGRYACLACGKPRQLKPGTTIVSGVSPLSLRQPVTMRRADEASMRRADAEAPSSSPTSPPVVRPPVVRSRGASAGLRMLGIIALASGVLGATAAAIFVPGAAGLIVAALVAGSGVGLGAWGLRAGSRTDEEVARQVDAHVELSILELAEARDGVLTVTDVARGLGLSATDADAALSAMVDGSRVSAEVTPDGLIRYVFRELRTLKGKAADEDGVHVPSPVRARVADEASQGDLDEAFEEVEAYLESRPPTERES